MRGPRRTAACGLLLLAGLLFVAAPSSAARRSARAQPRPQPPALELLFADRLEGSASESAEARGDLVLAREASAIRDFATGWTDGRTTGPLVRDLLELLANASAEGLDPDDYELERLRAMIAHAESSPPRSRPWLELELELSLSAASYGNDLAHGRLRPEAASLRWLLAPRQADVARAVARAIETGQLRESLEALAPRHPEYALLRRELHRLRSVGPTGAAPGLRDEPEAAVRRIELNMERWRWVPDSLGALHVRVNLPDFSLSLQEDGRELLRSRIIVGGPDWATPVFTDLLLQVMVNPYWNVPDVIARREILPKIKRDPALLQERRYTVLDSWRSDASIVDPRRIDWGRLSVSNFPYRLRQEPGGGNALGRLIFMLSNDFEIYLHDTPGRRLFDRAERALSHGCIRVEASRALAERLFGKEGRRSELEAGLASSRNATLSLREPVPLHVLHFTAVPESEGRVRMLPDLYGVDAALADALGARKRTSALAP